MTNPATPGQKRFAAWLLIVTGGLAVVLCGGCTLTFWTGELSGHRVDLGDISTQLALVVLVIGGLPTLVGVYMVWRGVRDLFAVRKPPDTGT